MKFDYGYAPRRKPQMIDSNGSNILVCDLIEEYHRRAIMAVVTVRQVLIKKKQLDKRDSNNRYTYPRIKESPCALYVRSTILLILRTQFPVSHCDLIDRAD